MKRAPTLVLSAFLAGLTALPGLAEEEPADDTVVETIAASPEATPTRPSDHPWERFVRGFRREHQFALSLGLSRGQWQVQRFGDEVDDQIKDQSFRSAGAWTKFQYSYHIKIYRGFGYLLGSSAGYHYERPPAKQTWRPVPGVQFPGVLAGFVLNINPVLRLSAALDVYLERYNRIVRHLPNRPDTSISVTLQAYDLGFFVDVFYELNWAIRLEAHARQLYYLRPKRQSGDPDFPVDATFRKEDRWLGLALVFHLL